MPSIYTCPDCRSRYTIHRDGDYICACGQIFYYPPVLSSERACFIPMESLSRPVRKPRIRERLGKHENGFAGMLVRVFTMTLF